MQCHQALTNLGGGVRIELAFLCISEKVIESLMATFPVVISRLVSHITSMTDAIIDWSAVRALRLRRIVSVMSSMMDLSITPVGALLHLVAMIIIAGCGSCEVLQVSDYK